MGNDNTSYHKTNHLNKQHIMKIKILGTGCPKCNQLEKSTREVLGELQLDADVEKVEDIMQIMNYGIASTPALVIDEKVVIKGRVPGHEELKKIIKQ